MTPLVQDLRTVGITQGFLVYLWKASPVSDSATGANRPRDDAAPAARPAPHRSVNYYRDSYREKHTNTEYYK